MNLLTDTIGTSWISKSNAEMAGHPSVYTTFEPVEGDTSEAGRSGNVLGQIRFGRRPQETPVAGSPKLGFPTLGIEAVGTHEEEFSEVWYSSRPVTYATMDGFRFGYDGEVLFGCVSFRDGDDGIGLERLTRETYLRLFRHIRQFGYPNLFRMWNYIPRINQEENGLERYRAFCRGRNDVFEEVFGTLDGVLPPATGIATNAIGRVDIYFLAQKSASSVHLQNPWQTPPHEYPVKYGPKPPSFSRATFVPRENGRFELYVSGTASIIGSETMHADDASDQCEATIDNIAVLLGEKNLEDYNVARSLSERDLDCIKIYYRRRSDLPKIRRICEERFSRESQKAYLQVDICRSDLLVEIEGSIQTGKADQIASFGSQFQPTSVSEWRADSGNPTTTTTLG